jgi:YD repeat-containing protein
MTSPSPQRYAFEWTTAGRLAGETAAWRDLSESAVEPNPAYGANVLAAAERHLRRGRPIPLLVARDAARGGALAALWPLEARDWRQGFPGRATRLFENEYTTLTHPLLRADDAAEILAQSLAFLAAAPAADPLVFSYLCEARGFSALLGETCARAGLATARVDGAARAAVDPEPGKSGVRYAREYLSKSRRAGVERRLKRLKELGAVDFSSIFADAPGGAAALRSFLDLEAKSWKGRAGTALANAARTRAFALEAFSGENGAPRVRLRSLTLEKRPVAMALDLESQGVAYAFKAAYDEDFARFSPGLLLDADTAGRVGKGGEIARLDSFAQTELAQDSVWRQREPVGRHVVALSGGRSEAEALAARLRAATVASDYAKQIAHRGRAAAAVIAGAGLIWALSRPFA